MKRLLLLSVLAGLAAGCSGDLLSEAKKKAKAACECKDAECVRPYIKWFNEKSLKEGGAAVKKLTPEKQAEYSKLAVQAGDCQVKLQQGGKK